MELTAPFRFLIADATGQPVFALCREAGWRLSRVRGGLNFDGTDDGGPLWLGFDAGRETTLALVYDRKLTDLVFVAVDGPAAVTVAERVRTHVEHANVDDIVAEMDSCDRPADRVECLLALAVAAPRKRNVRVVTRVAESLVDANTIVRSAALLAVRFRVWPDYLELVQRIARSDDAEAVRNDAAALVAYWHEVVVS